MNDRRTTGLKLNPTLFDKLVTDGRVLDRLEPGRAEIVSLDPNTTQLSLAAVPAIERYNEKAMRAGIRRELNWLLNTTHLEAVQDLDDFPQVKTSVLNYGVPDLIGRASNLAAVKSRAQELHEAIVRYEPRIDPKDLSVDITDSGGKQSVSFVIRGNIVSAVRAMAVQYVADLEVDSGEARVTE